MAIGPHKGRELALMREGKKPLAMFAEILPDDIGLGVFPEADFDALVAEGKLVKRVSVAPGRDPEGNACHHRRVLYALPAEEWRINAFIVVDDIYRALIPAWRPDLERVIGRLLGYSDEDVEQFLDHLRASGQII